MNCQESRKHLHPYLDSELEVPTNLQILEHLNACAACKEIFEVEERSWNKVRSALLQESAPVAFRQAVPRLLQREDRREFWRRTTGYLVPVGLAAAFLIYVMSDPAGSNEVTTPESDRIIHDHGKALGFTVSHFLDLDRTARKDGESGLLSRRLLDDHAELKRIDVAEARQVFRELLGKDAKLPPALQKDGITAARAHNPQVNGTPVRDLLLLEVDKKRQFGLYILNRDEVDLANLHLMEGVTTGLRIERCRHCHVIAVTRDDKVFILVTRPGLAVEPMIEMMKKTF